MNFGRPLAQVTERLRFDMQFLRQDGNRNSHILSHALKPQFLDAFSPMFEPRGVEISNERLTNLVT
jgi:hypothetical protein